VFSKLDGLTRFLALLLPAPHIGPKLKRMQLQLDNIEAELNLAITTRHAELSACSPGNPQASCGHQHDR
jgi:hypothetical protein